MKIIELLHANGLEMGRIITDSKSGYVANNPESICLFNSNICTENEGKVWFGDLDLTKDGETLKSVSEAINEVIYVLRETDARFGSENVETSELLSKAIWNTTQPVPQK